MESKVHQDDRDAKAYLVTMDHQVVQDIAGHPGSKVYQDVGANQDVMDRLDGLAQLGAWDMRDYLEALAQLACLVARVRQGAVDGLPQAHQDHLDRLDVVGAMDSQVSLVFPGLVVHVACQASMGAQEKMCVNLGCQAHRVDQDTQDGRGATVSLDQTGSRDLADHQECLGAKEKTVFQDHAVYLVRKVLLAHLAATVARDRLALVGRLQHLGVLHRAHLVLQLVELPDVLNSGFDGQASSLLWVENHS